MNTPEKEIKGLRRKAKSWLAMLTFYCALGQTQLDVLSQRLMSLYKPVVRPKILQRVIKNTLCQVTSQKETPGLKKRLMSRRASKRIEGRVFSFPQMLDGKTLARSKQNTCTLGRLVSSWAVLTDQAPKDFIVRVYPSINRLYRNWRTGTSCRGFSDGDCLSHPKEFAEFMSGFYRTLVQETPEENLERLMQQGISALGSAIETGDLNNTIYELCGQASYLMTADTVRKIESALKINPSARDRINIPEFKALVLWEETKLGWSENRNKASEILKESLDSELEEADTAKDDIIRSSMESIGRRSLLSNLQDALNGKLRPRLIESIRRLLGNIYQHMASTWEFDTSALIKENIDSIRRWLFRR